MNVPGLSAWTKRASRRIFKGCETVGCPIGKCRTMSHTQTALSLFASKFRIRIRVGSARALNHSAYSSACRSLSLGELTGGQQTFPPDPGRDLTAGVTHTSYLIHRSLSISLFPPPPPTVLL